MECGILLGGDAGCPPERSWSPDQPDESRLLLRMLVAFGFGRSIRCARQGVAQADADHGSPPVLGV